MEALLVEASRRDLEILLTLLRPIDAGLPLDERIALFVSRNARIYERMAPGWLAARLHEPFSAELPSACSAALARRRSPGGSGASGRRGHPLVRCR